MNPRLLSGAVAGLGGGVVFGVMMQIMNAPTPEGGSMPMMAMVAMVVRSTSIAVGWLYHLFIDAFSNLPPSGSSGAMIRGQTAVVAGCNCSC